MKYVLQLKEMSFEVSRKKWRSVVSLLFGNFVDTCFVSMFLSVSLRIQFLRNVGGEGGTVG